MLSLFVVVAALSGCGDARSALAGETEKLTQGGVSMEPTIQAGQVITVQKVGSGYQLRHGDIVAFHPSDDRWGDPKATYLKRVIALGGETVACCDQAGKVTVNGVPLEEPYVADDAPLDVPPDPRSCGSRRFDPVTVGMDAVFVMGDNRMSSNDSRCAGPIPAASVFAVMIS